MRQSPSDFFCRVLENSVIRGDYPFRQIKRDGGLVISLSVLAQLEIPFQQFGLTAFRGFLEKPRVYRVGQPFIAGSNTPRRFLGETQRQRHIQVAVICLVDAGYVAVDNRQGYRPVRNHPNEVFCNQSVAVNLVDVYPSAKLAVEIAPDDSHIWNRPRHRHRAL